MNTIVRNVLAVILGIVACFAAKFVIIAIAGSIIPPPEGVNMNDLESIKANSHLFQTKTFHYALFRPFAR